MDRSELKVSPDAPVAFVDVETTGGYPGLHRIIDVAVIGATGGTVDFEWQSLVNPGVRVPAGITALTGIDNDMLEGAPTFAQIAAELRTRLEGRVFVAHNVRFDYGFIRREFARLERAWRSPSLCTVRLSRALYPEMPYHNLDAVIERHGIQIEHRHRAMPDARALLEFWRRLHADWPTEEFQRALDRAAPRVRLPAHLSADLLDDLPEEPGIYRFFGTGISDEGDSGEEALLYVGKANNLRERVLDYFREGAHEAKAVRIAAQVRRVTWTETSGELGALLLEAREVRETQPVYNRQLRGGGERFTWLFADGPDAPRLVTLDADALRTGNAYGTYRSARDARHALESLAREHRWCFKLLGLEDGPGSCVGFQVGRCNGACAGREAAGVHLARVKLGLARERLEPWPHAGPVVVSEGSGARRALHVLDAWQYLASIGAGETPEDFAEIVESATRRAARGAGGAFDIDTYRILRRLLRNPRYRAKPLPRVSPPGDS